MEPGFGTKETHRFRNGELAERAVLGMDEASTAELYSYFWDGGELYFEFFITEDHKEELTRTEVRKYYDAGQPCRCLR